MNKAKAIRVWLVAGVAGAAALMCAQQITGFGTAPVAKGHVRFVWEDGEVPTGKPGVVELRFRVDDGFHVNSHKPLSEMLIPTELKLEPVAGLKVLGEEYPKGVAFKVGDETLDVYQGEFRVRLRVIAAKGGASLRGGLRYQACDKAACYPPTTLPVTLAVIAR